MWPGVSNEGSIQVRAPAMFVVMLAGLSAYGAEKLAWIEPHDIDIPGIVTDARGNPIAGADVEFLLCKLRHGLSYASDQIAHTRSDWRGRFEIKAARIDQHPNSYWVRATADGYAYGGVGLQPDGRFYRFLQEQPLDIAWIILLPAEKLEVIVVRD